MVARGTFDGYYEMNLKPWDVSAGVLILTEAGGKVTNIKVKNIIYLQINILFHQMEEFMMS